MEASEQQQQSRTENPFYTNYLDDPDFAHLKIVLEESKIPEAAYRFLPSTDEDFYFSLDKMVLRKIFYGGWQLHDREIEELKKFKEYLEEKGLKLHDGVSELENLRNLQAAKYNYQNAYDRLEIWDLWRNTQLPVKMTASAETIIHSGFCYISGRDRHFRPLLVIRPAILFSIQPPASQEDIMLAAYVIMEYMRNNFFLQGQVENLDLIIDLTGLGLLSFPYKLVKSLIQSINSYYRGVSIKVFILNGSFGFKVIWSTIKNFIDEVSLRKISLTNSNTNDEIKALVHPLQLEKQFGGEAENQKEPFWPPRLPPYVIDEYTESKLVKKEDYAQFIGEHPLFQRSPYCTDE